jgi:hypothetical protein
MRKPLLYSLYTIMNPAGGSDVEDSELGGRCTAGLKSPWIYRGLPSLGTFLCSAQHFYSFQIGPLSFRMLNELPGRKASAECQFLVDLPVFTRSFQALHARVQATC